MRKVQTLSQLVKTKKLQALNDNDQLQIKGGNADILIMDNLGG